MENLGVVRKLGGIVTFLFIAFARVEYINESIIFFRTRAKIPNYPNRVCHNCIEQSKFYYSSRLMLRVRVYKLIIN